jgi:signal transduction histidine kinase/CheY-like chemotaxis protein/GAF domain-containing protein
MQIDKPTNKHEPDPKYLSDSQLAKPMVHREELPTFLPDSNIILPDPVEGTNRPRVLIVDDKRELLSSLENSWKLSYLSSLDVRTWEAGTSPGLIEKIKSLEEEEWRPDVVVIDINMGTGGKGGIDYLADLRELKGYKALPVVLATGHPYCELNKKNPPPWLGTEWSNKVREHEPETILYGKTGGAQFLGRIGEHLPEWHNAARRRAWMVLLNEVAPELDGAAIKVERVADKVVKFAVQELQVDYAFVRWRESDKYKVVAIATSPEHSNYAEEYEYIVPDNVPILSEIIAEDRSPVLRENLTDIEAGMFKKTIAGHRFLGVGLVLGDSSVGFITLLMSPDKEKFSKEIDARYLSVLARLLASALGRDQLMRSRQTALLQFSSEVAGAKEKIDVCVSLTKFLHRELHVSDSDQGKVTVRLLDFGSGLLERQAHVGMSAEKQAIFIGDQTSIYAYCVKKGKLKRENNVSKADDYKMTSEGTLSELCTPLLIGKHAIGAVNLEHKKEGFYHQHDEDFVKAAAGLAASAIERIGNGKLLNGMAEFVHHFPTEDIKSIQKRLHDLLYEFSGYSALVSLERIDDDEHWTVSDFECKLENADPTIRQQIETGFRDKFDETWFGKQWNEKRWNKSWAAYTESPNDFIAVSLVKSPAYELKECADALLWLSRDKKPPHQALILMWGLPPPINADGVILLSNLARLFSELDSRRQNIENLETRYLLRAQAASLGDLTQHIRHAMRNLIGGMKNHVDLLELAHQMKEDNIFTAEMQALKNNAREIANCYNKAAVYVRLPELKKVSLSKVVDIAVNDPGLQDRLSKINLQRCPFDVTLVVQTDDEVAAKVLYSLLDNALDAIERQTDAWIKISGEIRNDIAVLTVADNGPGVSPSLRAKIFTDRQTTKPNGLGSALNFANIKMNEMKAKLVFPPTQPPQGAVFEMHFPLPKE